MRRTLLRGIILGLISAFVLSASILEPDSQACAIEDAASSGDAIWLLCQERKVMVSTDTETWREYRLPAKSKVRALHFLDEQRGFVTGDAGLLLATSDGGRHWRAVKTPATDNLTAIHSVGDLVWVAGWGGTILHSPDAGATWQLQPTPVTQGLDGIFFSDAEHGWAVGWVGTILRTSDGGRHWEQVRTDKAMWSLSAVYFSDARNGWVVGFMGQILHTTDGGETWERIESPSKGWLTSVIFDEANRGWITADDRFLVSDDGGRTWRMVGLNRHSFLSGLFRARGRLWAYGPGAVLRLPEGRFDVSQIENLAPGARRRTS